MNNEEVPDMHASQRTLLSQDNWTDEAETAGNHNRHLLLQRAAANLQQGVKSEKFFKKEKTLFKLKT